MFLGEVQDKSLSRSELTTRQESAFPRPKLHSEQLRTGNFLLRAPSFYQIEQVLNKNFNCLYSTMTVLVRTLHGTERYRMSAWVQNECLVTEQFTVECAIMQVTFCITQVFEQLCKMFNFSRVR